MTQSEYIDATRMLFTEFFTPIFQVIGAVSAVFLVSFVVLLVISPFVRRI